jgi:hypothetical protein
VLREHIYSRSETRYDLCGFEIGSDVGKLGWDVDSTSTMEVCVVPRSIEIGQRR